MIVVCALCAGRHVTVRCPIARPLVALVYDPVEPGDPRHGTLNGAFNLKCRCDACRCARNQYQREWRQRRKSNQGGIDAVVRHPS